MLSSSALEVLLETGTSSDANQARFLLSDKVSPTLSCTLTQEMSPVEYAQHLVGTGKQITFLKELFLPKTMEKMSDDLIRNYLFDQIVYTASSLRSIKMRPRALEDSSDVLNNLNLFLLTLNIEDEVINRYSGLLYFDKHARSYIEHRQHRFFSGETALLKRLANAVSNVDLKNWVMHHKHWQDACCINKDYLKFLRNFLHMAIMSYSIPDCVLRTVYSMTRDDVFTKMEEFITLRETSEPVFEEIVSFLESLGEIFYETNFNLFFVTMITTSFNLFETLHHRLYGDEYIIPVDIETNV